jgi:hypothetical protein
MTRRYRAFLIGNGDYPEDPANLARLEGPTNDVNLLWSALTDPACGMFARTDVTSRLEQPSGRLMNDLGAFFGRAGRDDVLLLYFSCHGVLDVDRTLHLCTRDTVVAQLSGTSISSTQLDELIRNSAAGSTVIIIDSCHSGAFKGHDIVTPVSGRGRYVLASCRGSELANDASQANHASLFTEFLVEGLRGAAGPGTEDGYLTPEHLYHYTYRRLTSLRKQTPQHSSSGEGRLPIARTTAAAPPPPVPVEAPASSKRRAFLALAAAAILLMLGAFQAPRLLGGSPATRPSATATPSATAGPSTTAGPVDRTGSALHADPAWLPLGPAVFTGQPPYGVTVSSPADQTSVAGPCIRITGTSALPAGKTLLIADRNIDGPPDQAFIYTPVADWDKPGALNGWHAVLPLGAASGQRYKLAVLVADRDVVIATWAAAPRSMVTSDTRIPGLQLAALLTVRQSSADGREC